MSTYLARCWLWRRGRGMQLTGGQYRLIGADMCNCCSWSMGSPRWLWKLLSMVQLQRVINKHDIHAD